MLDDYSNGTPTHTKVADNILYLHTTSIYLAVISIWYNEEVSDSSINEWADI